MKLVNTVNGIEMPVLSPLPIRHYFVLMQEWTYVPRGTNEPITIPIRFTTDLDTVPHIPIVFAIYKGYAVYSALVHDYLYTMCELSRKEADMIFYDAMLEEGVPKHIAKQMYYAVRAFGGRRYNHNSAKKSKDRLQARLLKRNNVIEYVERREV